VKGCSSEPCEHCKKTSTTHASNPPGAAPATMFVEGCQVKCLFPSEMEERRRLGLCYNYNEKFGHDHNKVCVA